MSFWDLSDGEDVTQTGGQFEVGGGSMQPIPNDTSCIAFIDEAKWDATRDGQEFISLRWSVVGPADYKNRKIFQKLWVTDADPRARDADKKRDKAKRMLAAIDTNAGGKLMAKAGKPTDESLTICLTNKPMQIKVMVWEMTNDSTGEKSSGNWIAAVSPKGSVAAAAPKAVKKAAEEGEEVPF
jgi:hypothetical protein